MKIDFYVDIFPGQKSDTLTATTSPYKKTKGSKRYKVTANIPESAFTGIVDAVAPVEETKEVDKD